MFAGLQGGCYVHAGDGEQVSSFRNKGSGSQASYEFAYLNFILFNMWKEAESGVLATVHGCCPNSDMYNHCSVGHEIKVYTIMPFIVHYELSTCAGY